MKKIVAVLIVVLLLFFFLFNTVSQNNKPIISAYPWQIEMLNNGNIKVFGLTLNETKLLDVDARLKMMPEIALYESNKSLALEAYYKNVSLGGLIGSFVFTLDASDSALNEIKKTSHKKERTESKEIKYKLDKFASQKAKNFRIKNLIYIPRVQLDEETIVKRFGKPAYKIKLKTKEMGWHYLYPEKGLDLIYKEEGAEVLQYVLPKNFNVLLEPLQNL